MSLKSTPEAALQVTMEKAFHEKVCYLRETMRIENHNTSLECVTREALEAAKEGHGPAQVLVKVRFTGPFISKDVPNDDRVS